MNDRLMKETGVDAVYYCPHHPEGKVKEYRKKMLVPEAGDGASESGCQRP